MLVPRSRTVTVDGGLRWPDRTPVPCPCRPTAGATSPTEDPLPTAKGATPEPSVGSRTASHPVADRRCDSQTPVFPPVR